MPLRTWLWRDGWIGWLVREIYRKKWKIIDHIPDDEKLWRAIYKKEQLYNDGNIKPAFFRDRSGLSCDLARFSSIEKSRLGYIPPPRPSGTGLVEIGVSHARAAGTDVYHKPIMVPAPNYSHCQFSRHLDTVQAQLICAAAEFRVKPEL